MDNTSVGKLILALRKELGMTQLQLAERMHISDKTVSKWERGLGCPDVSLLPELSHLLGVDLASLLAGSLNEKDAQGGSMKKTNFYVCPNCGNIITGMTECSVSCCGKKLLPLEAKKADEEHKLTVEKIENDYFLTTEHSMTKEHYISFMTLVTGDTVVMRKQYPEWNLQARIPMIGHGRLVWYCTQDGLFYQNI